MQANKSLPLIVQRNLDVEHIMLASAVFGVNGFGKPNLGKLFTMLAVADVHQSYDRMEAAIDYLNYYDAIDCGICLGDMQAGSYSDSDGVWYHNALMRTKKPFYTVLGNHDGGNYGDFKECGTPRLTFEKFIRPNIEKIGIEGLDRAYYMKTIDEYKIAIIVLTNYDYPDTLGADGTPTVDRSYEVYSQEQTDWLISALHSIPAEYHLILCAHSHPYKKAVEPCAFSQMYEYSMNTPYGNNNMIPDIIDAWKHGKAIKKRYAPEILSEYLPVLSVNADFSARGEGNFVCYLIGHHHCDFVGWNDKYRDQRLISLAAAANDLYQNYGTDLPRARGTKAEDLLTVLSFDTEKRKIRLVRIGSNMTVDMTERTYYVVEY